MASSSPSPLMADVLKMAHVLFLRAERPRAVDISEGVMAPSMSCLFANTINMAVFSSSSYGGWGGEGGGTMLERTGITKSLDRGSQ